MSAAAFAPAAVGGVSARVRRAAVCGLRMQADIKGATEDAGEDGPKMSRAQRRMKEKYSKKNTDGSLKATQQVIPMRHSAHSNKSSASCDLQLSYVYGL